LSGEARVAPVQPLWDDGYLLGLLPVVVVPSVPYYQKESGSTNEKITSIIEHGTCYYNTSTLQYDSYQVVYIWKN